MKCNLPTVSLISAAMLGAAGVAQAGPRFPFPIPMPVPSQPQTPSIPRPDDGPFRPLPTQTELRVESFAATELRCSTDFSSASYIVSARLPIQRDPIRGNEAELQILVDGASQATMNLTARDGYVTVSRRVNLGGGADAPHEIVFLLNGAVRSAPISAPHACISLQPSVAAAPGHLTLPNLAFGDRLYAELAPSGPPSLGGGSGRVRILDVEYFIRPIIVTDIHSTSGRIQFPANLNCPDERDAYVTARFAIAITASRVADPANYYSVSPAPTATNATYVDTRDQSRWPDGTTIGASQRTYRGTPLPQGYQWLVIMAPLACTRDGVIEVRLDPAGSLRETSEDDNRLRLRYATVPQ